MRLFLALVTLAVLAAPARAQSPDPLTRADSSRTLSVQGNGEVLAAPDRAVVSVGLKSDGETVEEALTNHELELARVEALIGAAGIPRGDWRITKSAVSKDQDQFGGEEEGFAAATLMSVNVDDLARVPTLLAAIANADDDLLVTHERSIEVQYVVRDLVPVRVQALRLAVRDAERRAGIIAEMSGMRLGAMGSVHEMGAQNFGRENEQDSYMGGTPNGDIRVSSSVSVTFPLYEAP